MHHNTGNSINRRETDAQLLRLIGITTVAFLVIGGIIWGIF
ncbi:MAG: hypothetical protein WAU15_11280 [Nitrosomonas sp.]